MKRFFIISSIVGLVGLVLVTLAGVILILWASRDLPSITKIADYRPPQVTTIYARDGSIMGYFYDEKRFLVTLGQMSEYLPKAFLALEDDKFYEHSGINYKAIVRAFVNNLTSDKPQGASTITQQVVKRLLLTNEKSYERKLKEAILAYRLEDYLSKEEILTIYLNQIFMGWESYGVEAAARTYFAKHANELTLAECAVLAAIPQAPSENNPYSNPEATRARQLSALNRMLTLGWITKDQHDEAVNEKVVYKRMPEPNPQGLGAWYLTEVRRRLIDFLTVENVSQWKMPLNRYGRDALYNSGLHIYTAMDPVHQAAAESALRQALWDSKRFGWVGPLDHIEPAGFADYLSKDNFGPTHLENDFLSRAHLTAVKDKHVEVALGKYKGTIAVNTCAWSKSFNSKSMEGLANAKRDIVRGPEVGDVILVSAYGAQGTANPVDAPAVEPGKQGPPPYESALVTADNPIQLRMEQVPILQGAMVSIEVESGDLVALVGGYGFNMKNQFNRATQAIRQPGSSFKPIVYSAAIDNGFTAGTIVQDAPFVGGDLSAGSGKNWRPDNFDGKFLGPIVLRTALALSRNTCTVRVAGQVGMHAIVQRARALGIEGNIPEDLAVSLGAYAVTPFTMAQAYTAFANQGKLIRPRMVLNITDAWGRNVASFGPDMQQVISPQNAYIMSYLLKEVVNAGTATKARVLGRPVAGKTGTSNDSRDAWFIGFSPYLVTSVFMGYDDNQSIGHNQTGGGIALPAFISYRQLIDHLYEPKDFAPVSGVSMMAVDAITGFVPGPSTTKSVVVPFMAGTGPVQASQDIRHSGANAMQEGDILP